MNHPSTGMTATVALLVAVLLLAPDRAHAFRCGSRIVQEGMHEFEVIRLCGEPASYRHLGYVTRAFAVGDRTGFGGMQVQRTRGWVREEVEVTELIFNFGPRKLMRKLRFEGGTLVSIRTIGYGYIEQSD